MAEPPTKATACAICGKPVDPACKPFCSKRCANLDLHRWLKGAYVIAGETFEDEPPPAGGLSRDDGEEYS